MTGFPPAWYITTALIHFDSGQKYLQLRLPSIRFKLKNEKMAGGLRLRLNHPVQTVRWQRLLADLRYIRPTKWDSVRRCDVDCRDLVWTDKVLQWKWEMVRLSPVWSLVGGAHLTLMVTKPAPVSPLARTFRF